MRRGNQSTAAENQAVSWPQLLRSLQIAKSKFVKLEESCIIQM